MIEFVFDGKLLVLHFQRFCWLPKERKNQRLVGGQGSWNSIRGGSIILGHVRMHAAQHTKRERERCGHHGPTECRSILSYKIANHGVPRLQTSLFLLWLLYLTCIISCRYQMGAVHGTCIIASCSSRIIMHCLLLGFWQLVASTSSTIGKGRSNPPFQKLAWTSFPPSGDESANRQTSFLKLQCYIYMGCNSYTLHFS